VLELEIDGPSGPLSLSFPLNEDDDARLARATAWLEEGTGPGPLKGVGCETTACVASVLCASMSVHAAVWHREAVERAAAWHQEAPLRVALDALRGLGEIGGARRSGCFARSAPHATTAAAEEPPPAARVSAARAARIAAESEMFALNWFGARGVAGGIAAAERALEHTHEESPDDTRAIAVAEANLRAFRYTPRRRLVRTRRNAPRLDNDTE
jgi:hypothetical protein